MPTPEAEPLVAPEAEPAAEVGEAPKSQSFWTKPRGAGAKRAERHRSHQRAARTKDRAVRPSGPMAAADDAIHWSASAMAARSAQPAGAADDSIWAPSETVTIPVAEAKPVIEPIVEPIVVSTSPQPMAPAVIPSAPAPSMTSIPTVPAASSTSARSVPVLASVAAIPGAASPVALAPSRPSAPGGPTRIGELLVTRGLITSEQLDHALAEQVHSGQRLGSEIVRLGMITERQLMETLADQLHVPVADLRMTTPDPDAVARFPEEVARRLEVVPLRTIDGTLEVAFSDVLNDSLRAVLEAAVSGPVRAVLAPPSEIRQAIDRCYMVLGHVASQVANFQALESARPRAEETKLEVDDNAPVVQVVSLMLTQAARDRASDVHIEPQGDKVRVRFRVDGVLRDVMEVPEAMAQSLVSRIKVMAGMNIVERRRPLDGQIATQIDGRPLDIRVSTTPTIFGEKAVLRLLDKTRGLLSLGDLGMTPDIAAQVGELVTAPFGMLLCAGPTGSGKTTTLYAALKAIDDPSRNITTIEDPVEYIVPSINQIQVNVQAGVTFADGLRSILRQDPDVILVGEVRDVETARIAVQSALTGHFVLSSVHATDSATTIQRLRDMGVEPFLVTASVLGVIAQRLVRRICPHCRAPHEPSVAERVFYERSTGTTKEVFWRGAGCNLCSQTGYSHRVGIYELLRITEPIRALIMADAGYEEIQAAAIAGGMRTLKDEVLRLVTEDVTTLAEATRTVLAH